MRPIFFGGYFFLMGSTFNEERDVSEAHKYFLSGGTKKFMEARTSTRARVIIRPTGIEGRSLFGERFRDEKIMH